MAAAGEWATSPATAELVGNVERWLGKVVAVTTAASALVGALDQKAPRELRQARKHLQMSLNDATRSSGRMLKATRRFVRKHPWKSAALVLAAAGAAVAVRSVAPAAAEPATVGRAPRVRTARSRTVKLRMPAGDEASPTRHDGA